MSLTLNPNHTVQACIPDGELQLANGQSVPIIAGGCTLDSLDGERNLNLQRDFVGDTDVRMLRDTGCGCSFEKTWCLKTRCLTKGLS